MRHDYKRHGASTLFAALSLLDGMVIGNCMPRHRHQEFIQFLKKINADTLAATTSAVPSAFHPDGEFVGEPGRAMVPKPHRSVHPSRQFKNVPELSAAIGACLDHHNQNPRIFVWTAPVERILTKAAKCKAVLDALP